MERKINLSSRKWLALTVAGVISVLSYGACSMMSESVSQDNTSSFDSLFPLSDVDTEEKENAQIEPVEETVEVEETPSESIDSPAPEQLASEEPAKVSKPKDYTIDENWFKGVGWHSMARKYKDYLVLVKADNPIWQEKADKIQKIVRENSGTVFYSYWYGYWDVKDITPANMHKLCTWALSYSEWTTFFRIGMNKHYFDLLWKMCGRDDMEKPAKWWYR